MPQNRCNFLICKWFITETSAIARKNASFELDIKSMLFLIVISFSRTWNLYWFSCLSYKSSSYWSVASILRQFCMILSPNKFWLHIFFLTCPRHCDQGLLIVIICYFQIWNKKEISIIINRVISSHMASMYLETPLSSIPIPNLPRLRASNVDRFNERKWLYTGKDKNQKILCTNYYGRGPRWCHSASGKDTRPGWILVA